MIRFAALSIATVIAVTMAFGGSAGFFGGVAVLAAGVTGFGLIVALFTELMRDN